MYTSVILLRDPVKDLVELNTRPPPSRSFCGAEELNLGPICMLSAYSSGSSVPPPLFSASPNKGLLLFWLDLAALGWL